MDKTYYLDIAKAELDNARTMHLLCDHFKIGKTTQSLDNRFFQNYSEEYDDITLLLDAGEDGALIDWLEKEMIQYCLDEYGTEECDNDQIGGGPDCKDIANKTNTAKLYVVFR